MILHTIHESYSVPLEMRSLVLLAAFLTVLTARGQEIKDENNEMEELRNMLLQSKNQNRKLEQQMNRLKLVWSALHQMCQTLAQPECGCEVDSVTPTIKREPENETLRVLSATSSGNLSNTVRMTVTYTAQEKHVTDWISIYRSQNSFSTYRTDGERTNNGSRKYSSSADFIYADSLHEIRLQIYSGHETVALHFEARNVMNATEQILPEYKPDLLAMNYTYTAQKESDMTISIVMRKDFENISAEDRSDIMDNTDVFFTGVNTSSKHHTTFEVYHISSDALIMSIHQKSDRTCTMMITLQESILQWGGLLIIRSPQQHISKKNLDGNLITNLLHGYTAEVWSPESGEMVPENTVGLIPIGNLTLATPVGSVMCIAMGNPTPDVKVYRVLKDGRRKKLKAKSIQFDSYTKVVVYMLLPLEKKVAGLYVCRAESGTAVAEEFRNVEIYEPVKFDESKTGVIKNNTNKVVFGCKVASKLNTELEFRIYDRYGHVVQQNSRHTISTVKKAKRTSRITLSVSPPDERLHTLVCVARTSGVEEFKEIELFPGEERDWDWDLYNGYSEPLFNMTTSFS